MEENTRLFVHGFVPLMRFLLLSLALVWRIEREALPSCVFFLSFLLCIRVARATKKKHNLNLGTLGGHSSRRLTIIIKPTVEIRNFDDTCSSLSLFLSLGWCLSCRCLEINTNVHVCIVGVVTMKCRVHLLPQFAFHFRMQVFVFVISFANFNFSWYYYNTGWPVFPPLARDTTMSGQHI